MVPKLLLGIHQKVREQLSSFSFWARR